MLAVVGIAGLIGFVAGLWLLVAALHEWLAWRLDRISAHAIVGAGLVVVTGISLLVVLLRKPKPVQGPMPGPKEAAERTAESAISMAKETSDTAMNLAKQSARERPMTTLGVALGAGLVLGHPTLRRFASHIGAAVLGRMIKP